MRKRKQNGPQELQSAVTTLNQKTVKASTSRFLNWRRIVRFQILILMFLLSLTSAAGLLIGVPCLTSTAVDYNQPVQYQTVSQTRNISSTQFWSENDWRQWSTVFNISLDAERTMQLDFTAVDNYGQDFESWVSVYVYGGTYDGRVLFDSGWSQQKINSSFSMYAASVGNDNYSLRVVVRLKYPDDSGHYNPPAQNLFSGASLSIRYTQAFNYSDLPPSWVETSTASTVSFPVPVFTTSTYIDWDSQVSGNDGVFQSIKYLISTTFGITDTWQSLVVVMNYINGKMPYVYAISFFCGVTGIAVWFLEK